MIQAFNQIRLTNNIVNASGNRLSVGGQGVVYQSETGGFATSANLISSGAYLTNLISASSAGVTSVNSATGVLTILGAGNVSVTTNGANITISGNTGQYSNFITTSQTGQFYAANNPNGFITSAQTGVFATSLNLVATGLSFATYTGKQQTFTTSIASGADNYFVQFPFNFPVVPRVNVTLEVTSSYIYSLAVSNRTISGYTCLFSDIVAETGVYLHTFASLN